MSTKVVRKKRSCPSGKVRYPDRQRAIKALHRIQNVDRGGKRQVTPVRAYECPTCHGAHLTSEVR